MRNNIIFLIPLLALLLGVNLYLYSQFLSEKTKISIENKVAEIKKDASNLILPTPAPKLTKIILGGDVMLGRQVTATSIQKNDFNYPFRNISNYLSTADLVFVNLENPIVKNCPITSTGLTFCSTPEMLSGLNFANIKLVSIANNHIENFGKVGFEETKTHLRQAGIDFVGDGNIVVKLINNKKYAFVAFDFLSNKPKISDFELIKKARSEADIVIVGVHWGNEYKSVPEVFQQEWAKSMVNAGAEVISGHHPHWVQNKECIKPEGLPHKQPVGLSYECEGGLVYYSLGNLVFDQMWSEETKKGLLVELTFDENGIINEKFLKTYISGWGQVEIVE